MISTPCNPFWNFQWTPYCINKIYIQSFHEAIKIDSDQNSFIYSNLKNKKFNKPIIWKNDYLLTKFDQFTITKSDYTIEVKYYFT